MKNKANMKPILTYVSREETNAAKRKLLESVKRIDNGFYFDLHKYEKIKKAIN